MRYITPYQTITLENLYDAECYFTPEELKTFRKKSNEILSNLDFRDEDSRSLAEKMFKLGYLAAHAFPPNDPNLITNEF